MVVKLQPSVQFYMLDLGDESEEAQVTKTLVTKPKKMFTDLSSSSSSSMSDNSSMRSEPELVMGAVGAVEG